MLRRLPQSQTEKRAQQAARQKQGRQVQPCGRNTAPPAERVRRAAQTRRRAAPAWCSMCRWAAGCATSACRRRWLVGLRPRPPGMRWLAPGCCPGGVPLVSASWRCTDPRVTCDRKSPCLGRAAVAQVALLLHRIWGCLGGVGHGAMRAGVRPCRVPRRAPYCAVMPSCAPAHRAERVRPGAGGFRQQALYRGGPVSDSHVHVLHGHALPGAFPVIDVRGPLPCCFLLRHAWLRHTLLSLNARRRRHGASCRGELQACKLKLQGHNLKLHNERHL